jgi:mRNA-degrading endonuclease RelE of RelBE toxin-antitoxin system
LLGRQRGWRPGGVVAEADKVEGYEYRIVYSVEEEVLTMVTIRIGHRRESYGRL